MASILLLLSVTFIVAALLFEHYGLSSSTQSCHSDL